jgi:hypothetical protein
MPYMTRGKRDYKKQYEAYDGTESVKKDRAKRNAARKMMEDDGKVKKGDGKDVNHKKALSKGGTNKKSNLEAVPKSKNRSFSRTKTGKMK